MEFDWNIHADERFLKQLDTDIENYFGHIPQYTHIEEEQCARNALALSLASRFAAATEHARTVLSRRPDVPQPDFRPMLELQDYRASQPELLSCYGAYASQDIPRDYASYQPHSQPELLSSHGACYVTSQGSWSGTPNTSQPEIQLQFYARAPQFTRRVSHEHGTYSTQVDAQRGSCVEAQRAPYVTVTIANETFIVEDPDYVPPEARSKKRHAASCGNERRTKKYRDYNPRRCKAAGSIFTASGIAQSAM